MQTHFSPIQLADPDTRDAEAILRRCVHCGFCTATCPTFVLLGDELDSPRGRIYLIKDMLENQRPPTETVVRHIDRCLSCLSCMTTCPSGVHYMHLIDHARHYVEATHRRPAPERALRRLLAFVLPRPGRFRLALLAAALAGPLARPLMRLLPGGGPTAARLRAMLALAPRALPPPSPVERPAVHRAQGPRRARVALLAGCAQQVLAPEINETTIRLLTRLGVEVVVARGAGCCGALVHHMGRSDDALAAARANIAAWTAELAGEGLDAVIVNASGCGTQVKDYGHLLRNDAEWAAPAARIAGLARDVTEFLAGLGYAPAPGWRAPPLRVAYHSACSLQHGQKISGPPRALLQAAGFAVLEVPEGHLCCGSAGTYNLMQPAIAEQLRARKLAAIESRAPDLVAAGNIGCIAQLAGGGLPVVHTVALLDWAAGGPVPAGLEALASRPAPA